MSVAKGTTLRIGGLIPIEVKNLNIQATHQVHYYLDIRYF